MSENAAGARHARMVEARETGVDVYDPGGGYDLYDTAPSTCAVVLGRWARALGGLGEVLITLGLVIALYAVYELWWSNITAGQETRRNSTALLHTWSTTPRAAAVQPSDAIADGQSFGFLYIPAFGADWRALIMQTVDRTRVLNTGAVGHYTQPASALPWDASGNFALAGHRDGHGMIFRDLDRLRPGDPVYVQTAYGWFVYRLDREAASVPINDVGAVAPIPVGSGYTKPGRYITLTTCTPMYIDSSRMAWWGHLVEQTPKGQVPAGVTPIS
ncbi:class E sortase [Actinocrinis puniceicyclus]|uniref:Class E sortase n=1 Tax=Actinocrinis puniceicyclus TaxID=977794 RepID=A0A8J8BAC7_9ACTN|nr:class E sortase [Actinocrinis puniceicyclus]MBS2961943.1 class E sortase [Actinocrinis puniceicyclus]